MSSPTVLAIILAGGSGSRMGALTETRAKPALRMAGSYRLIDVSLSNLVHSNLSDVWIVEEHQPHSFNQYLSGGRAWDLDRSHGGLVLLPPFSGDDEKAGFSHGNSDSLWRQNDRIKEHGPDLVLVLSADHLYTLDFTHVITTHVNSGADLTMVTTEVDENASRYSVVDVAGGRVTQFWYKPDVPRTNVVAAEIFCFTADGLIAALDGLREDVGELGDYGDDLLPWYVENKMVVEHRLGGYWKDLGTLTAYWQAHMDVIDGSGPELDDREWPIYSAQLPLLPARIEKSARIDRSYVAPGCRVSGTVRSSVAAPLCTIDEDAVVEQSILLDEVHVPAGVNLHRCIVDTGARLKPGTYGSPDSVTLIDADARVSEDE
ncbi:glucose-1-phosphate adenylyltransferase family protein [Flaviflexus huanghaiensis]|uniref:glucose-1-phosphate adenylyltransferase family protein n=1 Tax=Flaviflexus huanghaiensis TaxID=1111473 RepID=UPI0015FE5364|nr:sugar phosphate nucleotidyltransferase [Flaviflexus huanghaiensis]